MNIYLIGYRCTGKTTAGTELARRLGRRFVDSDREVVRSHGMTIQHIVQAQGWEAFREKEKAVLGRICDDHHQVVATGGGVVLDEENVTRMKSSGRLIWLKASADTIGRRMAQDRQTDSLRPSLTSRGAADEIEETLQQRLSLYERAADIAVDTDEVTIDALCDDLMAIASELISEP